MADPNDPLAALTETASGADVNASLYDRIAGDLVHGQRALIDEGLDSNPDDAAEAVRLSRMTGTPAEAIAADQDKFKQDTRRSAAMQLVLGNPVLTEYLQSHPMASQVSSDDWGLLDKYVRESHSDAYQALGNKIGTEALAGAAKGWEEGGIDWIGMIPPGAKDYIERAMDPHRNVLGVTGASMAQLFIAALGATAGPAYKGVDTVARLANALGYGIVGGFHGMGEAAEATGLPQAFQKLIQPMTSQWPSMFGSGTGTSLAEELGQYGEYRLGGGGEGIVPHVGEAPHGPFDLRKYVKEFPPTEPKVEGKMEEIKPEDVGEPRAPKEPMLGSMFHKPPPVASPMDIAQVYMKGGQIPPAGLHPDIDAALAQINADHVELLKQDLANAAASNTRARDPEMFTNVNRRGLQGTSIGIHPDVAAALYPEGKAPMLDDGVLGWVPNIESQLEAARVLGTDVKVPVSDFLAKMDPKVADGLWDGVRMWDGGITAVEAAEAAKQEPKQVITGALPMERAAQGLEPKFSIGDRKLTLEQKGEGFLQGLKTHEFDILDENRKVVGDMKLSPSQDGKGLYVHWIGGQAGLWSNSFGPALTRDLLRQLKVLYPDANEIIGFRISGARQEGVLARMKFSEADPNAVRVPLGWDSLGLTAEGHQRALDIFQNAWVNAGEGWDINVQKPEFYTPEQQAVSKAVEAEVAKLTGGKAVYHPVAGIRAEGERAMAGAYSLSGGAHNIFVDLLGANPRGVGRHESIHMLRRAGLISDAEWAVLSKAAEDGGWLEKHNIHERYKGKSDEAKVEEAIAEEFRTWAGLKEAERPKSGIHAVFQKIWDWLDRIRTRAGQLLGREMAWEEIFQKVHSGEIGWRDLPGERPAMARPKFSIADDREQQKAIIEGINNLQAETVGQPKAVFEILQKAIRDRGDADLAKATARAQREQRRRQTAEWKDRRAQEVHDAAQRVREIPAIAADLFVGSGEHKGEKLKQRFPINPDTLSPEVAAALPEHYLAKNGVDANHIAPLFGYAKGDEMGKAIAAVQEMKVKPDGTKMLPGAHIRALVQAEADRAMEAKYGKLEENILSDAKDQALSESSMNVLHQDVMAAAQLGGVTVFDKPVMRNAARDLVDKMTVGEVSSIRLADAVGKWAKKAQAAILKNNMRDAAIHMQTQEVTAYAERVAKELEKDIAEFKADAAKWGQFKMGKLESSLPHGHAVVIQKILKQIGLKVGASLDYLSREFVEGDFGTSVREFVAERIRSGATIDAFEPLLDPNWGTKFENLTAEEFGRIDTMVRQLVHDGKAEKTQIIEGVAYDWVNVVRPALLAGLERLPPAMKGPLGKGARTVGAFLIRMETYVDKLDRWVPTAAWNKHFLRPLFDAEHTQMDRMREMLSAVHELVALNFDNDELPSIFRDPSTGQRLVATKETLWAAMLNQGNPYNRKMFALGWGLKPEMVREWIDSHAADEDWDGVQKIWDMFAKTGEWSRDEYRRMGDRPMKTREAEPITTASGKVLEGGYFPVMFHPDYPGSSAMLLGLNDTGLFGDGYSSGFLPGAGYTVDVSGYKAPYALDLKQVASRLQEQIHDGAMRGSLKNSAKVLMDPAIRNMIINKLGREVYDEWVMQLRRIANKYALEAKLSSNARNIKGVGDYLRKNIISNMVGLNPTTIEKHGPTALMFSVARLGPGRMLDAYQDLFLNDAQSSKALRQKVFDKSAVMRDRLKYWQDDLPGAVQRIHHQGELMQRAIDYRKYGQWLATMPVAMSDMFSALPLWWGTYKKAMEEGLDEGNAVYLADKEVRTAHGAGGIVGQAGVFNSDMKFYTAMYNFYNSALNMAVTSAWRAGEARRNYKAGDLEEMQRNMKAAALGGFVVIMGPIIIHDLVSPPKSREDDSWPVRGLKYLVAPASAMVPGGANVVDYLTGSSTPDVGIQTAAYKELLDFPRDLLERLHKSGTAASNEKLIRDAFTTMGFLYHPAGRQIGRTVSGLYGYEAGAEEPQDAMGMKDLLLYGHAPKAQ